MTSPKEVFIVPCVDMIEMDNTNSSDNYELEAPTFRFSNELTLDDDTTSSIVSDFTEEGSTMQVDITSAGNAALQQDLSNNHIYIERSSDILIGSKTLFNGSVVIQNYIAGNDVQNPFASNHNLGTLGEPSNGPQTTDSSCLHTLHTYIPCKSKWFCMPLLVVCVFSVLGGLAVAVYFLYLHFGVYTVAGAIFVCKTNDTSVCYIGSSTTSCSNVVTADGRPFISGHTTSGVCKIYSKQNCRGDVQEIETTHVSFYFDALSAKC